MKEALKRALDALEYWDVHGGLHQPSEEAITAIKAALAQPAQRSWVGLTDEEIDTWKIVGHESLREFVRAIEAKLRELNT